MRMDPRDLSPVKSGNIPRPQFSNEKKSAEKKKQNPKQTQPSKGTGKTYHEKNITHMACTPNQDPAYRKKRNFEHGKPYHHLPPPFHFFLFLSVSLFSFFFFSLLLVLSLLATHHFLPFPPYFFNLLFFLSLLIR